MNASKIINDNFLHHATFLQVHAEGMMTVRDEGFCYADSGLSCDTFNIVYITHGERFNVAGFQNTVHHFESKQADYCVWINEENLSEKVADALNNAGLQEADSEPGMIIELNKYNHASPGGNIRKLSTPSMLEEFAVIVSCNWQPPDQNVVEFYKRVAPVIFNDQQHNIEYFGIYEDGKLVSAMEVFPDSNTNAGLYSLCTLAEYRGKGLATSLMRHCLDRLKLKGYVTATLQAADDGLNIYKKLGFVQTTRFHEFKPA